MRFRPLQDKDIGKINEIYEKYHMGHFGIPPIHNTLCGVVVDDLDVVLGFGMVRLIPEVIMVLDLGRDKKDKCAALKELMQEAVFEISRSDYDSLHAFVQDKSFAEILKKHYGFKTVKGEALILEVR